MEWLTLENIFLILFLTGLVFTVVTAILSGAFEHDFGQGSAFADGDASALGGDPSTDFHGSVAEVGWDQSMLSTFSPLSPTVIAAFATAFGGMGYLGVSTFEWNGWASGFAALLAGVVVAGGVFLFMTWVFGVTQGSSIGSLSSLVGKEAEVTVTIPPRGKGEVAYILAGQRSVVAARSGIDGPIPQGTRVVIKEVSATEFLVEETRESWLARSRSGAGRAGG